MQLRIAIAIFTFGPIFDRQYSHENHAKAEERGKKEKNKNKKYQVNKLLSHGGSIGWEY